MATLLFLAVVAMPRMTFAADSKPVVDVTYVKVNGDVAGFVELIAKGRALGKKLRPDAKVSVYVHMLAKAGPYSGMVSVSVIHPSYVDWAEGQQILTASPEWQAFMQEFMAAGYEAVSSGLSVQVADFE
jgi:hypothetical protein